MLNQKKKTWFWNEMPKRQLSLLGKYMWLERRSCDKTASEFWKILRSLFFTLCEERERGGGEKRRQFILFFDFYENVCDTNTPILLREGECKRELSEPFVLLPFLNIHFYYQLMQQNACFRTIICMNTINPYCHLTFFDSSESCLIHKQKGKEVRCWSFLSFDDPFYKMN